MFEDSCISSRVVISGVASMYKAKVELAKAPAEKRDGRLQKIEVPCQEQVGTLARALTWRQCASQRRRSNELPMRIE